MSRDLVSVGSTGTVDEEVKSLVTAWRMDGERKERQALPTDKTLHPSPLDREVVDSGQLSLLQPHPHLSVQV